MPNFNRKCFKGPIFYITNGWFQELCAWIVLAHDVWKAQQDEEIRDWLFFHFWELHWQASIGNIYFVYYGTFKDVFLQDAHDDW